MQGTHNVEIARCGAFYTDEEEEDYGGVPISPPDVGIRAAQAEAAGLVRATQLAALCGQNESDTF